MHALRTLRARLHQEVLSDINGLLHWHDDLAEHTLFQELVEMALYFVLLLLLLLVALSDVAEDD